MRRTHVTGRRRTAWAAALTVLFVAVVCLAAAPANAAVTPNSVVSTWLTGVTQAQLQPPVNDLSGENSCIIGGSSYTFSTNRMSNENVPGYWNAPVDMAEQYLYEKLSTYGLDSVIYQTFPGDGDPLSGPIGRNVIGQITGTTKPNEIVTVSCHLDDMNDATWPNGRAPGADDNASGASAVLYMARTMAGHRFDRTIRFCFFDAEENAPWDTSVGNLYGSGYYAAQAKAANENIVGEISCDALAYNPTQTAGMVVECHVRPTSIDTGLGDQAIETMWTDAITAYGITGLTPTRIRNTQTKPSTNFSFWNDCGGFWVWGGLGTTKGYNGVWIVEEEAVNYNHNWHTANDLVSTFDWTQYVKLTQSIVALSAHEAGVDVTAPTVDSLTSSTHPVQANWYANSAPSLSWTASDTQNTLMGYSYLLDQSAGTVPDATSEGAATATSFSGKADGTWYFHVRAEDAFANWSTTSTYALRIDTAGPTTTDDSDGLPHRLFMLQLTPTDATSGVALTQYRIDDGPWKTGTSVRLVRTIRHKIRGLSRGDHLVEYFSTDNAGNSESVKSCTVTL